MIRSIIIKNSLILFSLLSGVSALAQFSQQSKIVSPDRGSRDEYGTDVDIRGDFAISGTPRYNIAAGAAYIYAKDVNGEWSHHQSLIPNDSKEMAEFGGGVKITEDYIVVASGRADIGSTIRAGALYVYNQNGITWDFNAKLIASDFDNDAMMGMNLTSLDAEGNLIVAGAPGKNGWVGAVYIFERIENTWTEVQIIESPDPMTMSSFGIGVSLSENTLVIGANEANGLRGSSYIYSKDAAGLWVLTQQISASDANPGDYFGSSVSIDNNTIVVGAYGANNVSGAAYVFKNDGSGNWEEVQKLTASTPVADAHFGFQCEVKEQNIIIGAPHAWAATKGEAFWFQEKTNGEWELEQLIQSEDIKEADFFGWSVALHQDQIIVGAPWENTDVNGNNPLGEAGSAYIFKDPTLTTVNYNFVSNKMHVYPNPIKNVLSIESYNKAIAYLKLYSINGFLIKEVNSLNTQVLEIDTAHLTSGIYLLNVEFSDGSKTIQKLIKS